MQHTGPPLRGVAAQGAENGGQARTARAGSAPADGAPASHPVHMTGAGPPAVDTSPRDPGGQKAGPEVEAPFSRLAHPTDAAASAAARNRDAKVQGHKVG